MNLLYIILLQIPLFILYNKIDKMLSGQKFLFKRKNILYYILNIIYIFHHILLLTQKKTHTYTYYYTHFFTI